LLEGHQRLLFWCKRIVLIHYETTAKQQVSEVPMKIHIDQLTSALSLPEVVGVPKAMETLGESGMLFRDLTQPVAILHQKLMVIRPGNARASPGVNDVR
jgi:hypothetical protein